jgi:sulfatase maturation enzyme AslB (radical SAM superfamily)
MNVVYNINNERFVVTENSSSKVCGSNKYNFIFSKDNGSFLRWGSCKEEDPLFSPVGPEILDLEISSGQCRGNCRFCYKDNSPEKRPENMSFDQFKTIVDKFPKTLTQIAFGICDLDTNPDFFKMMEYAKSIGVIPNFTTNGLVMTDDLAQKIVDLCGAVAVSVYPHTKNDAYNSIKTLTDLGLNQTNIHLMVSKETLNFVHEVIDDSLSDPKLKNLNAIVFLGLKPKGRSVGKFNPLERYQFIRLCELCFDKNISFGFDSCSAPRFEDFVRNTAYFSDKKREDLLRNSESCESGLFSSYVNVNGDYFPCSFCEGEGEWSEGISVLGCDDFFKDVWYHRRVVDWRKKLIDSSCDGCRKCLVFPEIN